MTDDSTRAEQEQADDSGALPALLETADAALLPLVESVLEAAGIPYLVQGGEAAGLFPLGSIGTTMSGHGLAAVVRVPAERLEEARALLRQAALPAGDDSPR